MKLIFVGGKGAPSSYVFGQVYELPERYANFPWFKTAPQESKTGDIVPVKIESPKKPETKPMPRKKLTVAPGFVGLVRLRFNAKAKSAPAGKWADGEIVELPVRYASFPWFDLVEPVPEIKIDIIDDESVYKEDGAFLPGNRDEGIQMLPLEELKDPQRIRRDTSRSGVEPKPEVVDEKPVEEAKPEPETKTHKPFKDMTKDELAAYVKEKGGEVTERDTKRTLTGKALLLEQA